MTDQTYNGWSNRETWTVNLWLTNDQYLNSELEKIALGTQGDYANGEALREFVQETLIDPMEFDSSKTMDGFITDMLQNAIARVDWTEIVRTTAIDL